MTIKTTKPEYVTKEEFVQLTTNLQRIVSAMPSQRDVSLVGESVSAKFDALRVAIEKSTDFETLKTRLLAVL